MLLGGSAALEILTYFALHLKHLEYPAVEKDQPCQVPLLEIRRGTISLFVRHSLRGDWKGFLFPGAAREGGGQDSNKINSRTPRGTKL